MASLYSLYLGLRFDRQVSDSLASQKLGYHPKVCLVMPCRGLEHGLEENIESALQQTYDNYRIAVITDSIEDPAYDLAKSVLARHPQISPHIYTAETFALSSGKVAALLTVLAKESAETEVFAFIDSDALIPPRWLADLIQPLSDSSVGATTGFRWYFPSKTSIWSYVQSAWNASGTNLLFDDRYNFPWGGAMAVRTETLEKINIRQLWADAISDDLTLNLALRNDGYKVRFLPQCTVASSSHPNWQSFLEWVTRQTALTKTFNRSLWNYALAAYVFLDLVFLLGVVSLVLCAVLGKMWLAPVFLLFTPSVVGLARSFQRNSSFSRAMPEFSNEFRRGKLGEAIASLIVPWVMTYGIIRSARTDEIQWRGRAYKLSRTKTIASPRSIP